jgi:hypothetical protein
LTLVCFEVKGDRGPTLRRSRKSLMQWIALSLLVGLLPTPHLPRSTPQPPPALRCLAWQPRCCAAEEATVEEATAEQEAQSFFAPSRATSGVEAFADTRWSAMMTLKESGTVLFSMYLMDDDRAKFSDTEKLGEWQCEQAMVVLEKPEGLYNSTLYLSATLQVPTPEQPRYRLVEGVVQQSFPIEGSTDEVELRQVGTFGAHEQIEDIGSMGDDDEDVRPTNTISL